MRRIAATQSVWSDQHATDQVICLELTASLTIGLCTIVKDNEITCFTFIKRYVRGRLLKNRYVVEIKTLQRKEKYNKAEI